MRNPDLIPERDADFSVFSGNITLKATENQGAWDIPASDIAQLQSANTQFQDSWAIARVRNTRTSVQVRDKQRFRKALESVLRPFLHRFVLRNPLVSDGQRVAMQIKPRKTTRTRVPVSDTIPFVSISRDSGNSTLIHFRQPPNAEGCSRRAMPKGVLFLEIAMTKEIKPGRPEDCRIRLNFSRTPARIEHQPENRLKEFFFYGRWINVRGEPGAWSDMRSFVMV